MKRFSEQFHKKASAVKLQAAEKRELRERLVSYMEYHPLPESLRVVESTAKQAGVGTSLFAEPFKTFRIPFATLFYERVCGRGLNRAAVLGRASCTRRYALCHEGAIQRRTARQFDL